MNSISDAVSKYVGMRIKHLADTLSHAGTKAELAELRRGIGKKPGELPKLWGSFLADLPEELESDSKDITYAEWAVYTALTLYALHQQGNSESVNSGDAEYRLGSAVRKLVRSQDDEERVMRRFSAMATSSDMVELSHHLRSMIQLLKAGNVRLDYADLAKDLYRYQYADSIVSVRLKWGRDYYREDRRKAQEANKNETNGKEE